MSASRHAMPAIESRELTIGSGEHSTEPTKLARGRVKLAIDSAMLIVGSAELSIGSATSSIQRAGLSAEHAALFRESRELAGERRMVASKPAMTSRGLRRAQRLELNVVPLVGRPAEVVLHDRGRSGRADPLYCPTYPTQ
jgi:hypothetical protein